MIKKRTSAAIVGLLDDIKSSSVASIDSIMSATNKTDTIAIPKETSYLSQNFQENSHTSPSGIEYEVRKLKTNLIMPWKYANRINSFISPESCLDLIESFKSVGQQIPIIIRRDKNSSGYELICGARRLFACNHLSIDVLAAIVDLSDQEALLAMDAENRPRQDISPYERALDYKRWIENGFYKNYAEICEAIGVKKSWFSQLTSLADLDESIINAFKHPSNLLPFWGYELFRICKSDKTKEQKMISLAQELAKKDIAPTDIYKCLKNLSANIKQPSSAPKKANWVYAKNNQKVFKIGKYSSGYTQFTFNKDLPTELIDELKEVTKEYFNKRLLNKEKV